jgi:hypothetical protein
MPASTVTVIRAHSEIASASFIDMYAATTLARLCPRREASARKGSSPAAPPDLTTLPVAYEEALSSTIGARGMVRPTRRNACRAWVPRLRTPSATSPSPTSRIDGERLVTEPIAASRSPLRVDKNQTPTSARIAATTLRRALGHLADDRSTRTGSSPLTESVLNRPRREPVVLEVRDCPARHSRHRPARSSADKEGSGGVACWACV